jgi:hypothetical protein
LERFRRTFSPAWKLAKREIKFNQTAIKGRREDVGLGADAKDFCVRTIAGGETDGW